MHAEEIIGEEQLIILTSSSADLQMFAMPAKELKTHLYLILTLLFSRAFLFFRLSLFALVFLGYFVALAVLFIFFVLPSLELIVESFENPFDTDTVDLPIYKF